MNGNYQELGCRQNGVWKWQFSTGLNLGSMDSQLEKLRDMLAIFHVLF